MSRPSPEPWREPLWEPSPERKARANLTRFAAFVAEARGEGFADYAAMHRWSVEEPQAFWSALFRFLDPVCRRQPETVIRDAGAMPGTKFFPEAELNFAENLLRYRGPLPAIIFHGEDGRRRELSRDELHDEVARVAAGLRLAGVEPGDRVAGYLPNCPETVIAMLAASSLGAVWSSCSPDFGLQGVLDRFGQIAPKVLFVTDGYRYNGRVFDMRDTVAGILAQLPDVQTCVVVPFVEDEPAIHGIPRGVHYADFAEDAEDIEFARLPFDHPLYVMYSSGTTGTPKCIVHGAGGTLIQQMKEHVLHVDLKPGDHLFYFTTCGWMMWNWLVAGLACGATLVLYDGSPFHPDGGRLWRMAEQERVNVFGTSAKYIAALEKAGLHPGRDHDLSALRTVLSTGSPLAPASFDYVYREIADDVLLASISGGTDILGCFAGGCPIRPVWRGELQCRMLGMAVEVWDEDGTPLTGEKGELVCTQPFPSMPIGFWNDDTGEKYRDAYFTRFPGVWAHGDFAELTEHDGMIIHGRSDAVLNPGGVRIGTAEIYRQVEKIDDVLESIAIGQDRDDDVRVVLFVVLRPGVELDERLESRIRRVIRENATPRHVPAKILAVPDIPRTISGKITELAVRSVVHGETVKNTDALANPEALEYFRDRPELAES